MTQPPKQLPQRRSRRCTRQSGLPSLAAQLPNDFRSPTAVNGFIYSLTVEVTAGRVEPRTAAILGYLSQLAIQTLPLLRSESEPKGAAPTTFQFISSVPRPDYSSKLSTLDTALKTAAMAQISGNNSREGNK
jgi:hypothetical protein